MFLPREQDETLGNQGELSVTGQDDDDTELPPSPPPPQDCSSPVPSASVSSRQARQGKKCEHEELLDYMEKADNNFLQLNKDMMSTQLNTCNRLEQ
ncbi:hypothetical protein FQN60_005451, partial [Etheostoma spectabile]